MVSWSSSRTKPPPKLRRVKCLITLKRKGSSREPFFFCETRQKVRSFKCNALRFQKQSLHLDAYDREQLFFAVCESRAPLGRFSQRVGISAETLGSQGGAWVAVFEAIAICGRKTRLRKSPSCSWAVALLFSVGRFALSTRVRLRYSMGGQNGWGKPPAFEYAFKYSLFRGSIGRSVEPELFQIPILQRRLTTL